MAGFALATEALTELLVDYFGTTEYRYGPGELAVTAYRRVDDGVEPLGNVFRGRIAGIISVFEGDCFSEMACAVLGLRLGRGSLDAAFAAALGVRRRTAGGEYHINLDFVTGDETSEFRLGHWNGSSLQIATVPEPGVAALLMVGLVAVGYARERRR